MDEKQNDILLPYLQDLVQRLNDIEVEKVKSPMHIRFGR